MHQKSTHIDSDNPNAVPSSRNRLASILASLAAFTSVYIVFYREIHQRLATIFDPYSFNGDALQHIAPLWFVWDKARAANDYITTYYLEAILPPLFKAIYALLTIFWTPIFASKVVALTLSILFIATVTATSVRLAGLVAGYLTLLFATGGVLKNVYFMGGIQRGFGIWLASLALYLLTSGNILGLAITAIVAASLYPTATVLVLTCLGTVLLLTPNSLRGSASSWSLTKRLGWLAGTSLVCTIVALPQIVAGARYGERLSIADEAEFPEWSAQGRYTQGDRGVPVSFFSRSFRVAVSGLSALKIRESKEQPEGNELQSSEDTELSPSHKGAVVLALTGIAGLIYLVLERGKLTAQALRCGVFLLSTAISYAAATLLFPLLYIPSRYIALGIIPIVPALVPCVWSSAITALARSLVPRTATASTLVIGCIAFTWLGWFDLNLRKLPSAEGYRPLFKFIRALPQECVIATWPRGIGNMVPLFTAHNTLLFEEGHQVFHRNVTEETRRRMRAVIALYSATDQAPLKALRRDYGVTHILFDTRHLTKTPSYFEPFQSEIAAARQASVGAPLYLEQLSKHNAALTLGPFVIIDVSQEALPTENKAQAPGPSK